MRGTFLKNWVCVVVVWLCFLAGAGSAVAGHGEQRAMKKAVLLAAFGTSVPDARAALDNIEACTRKEFPGVEVRWAYESKIIRAKLAKEGKKFDSPEMALARLMDDGYTHVAVLSLQTIPGEEFHNLQRTVELFSRMGKGFDRITVALPLLSSHEDMDRAAKAMMKSLPAGRKAGESVLLMGHGSGKHPSDGLYLAMNQIFQEMDPNAFVATVEGYPTVKDVLPKLQKNKSKTVWLVPFMAVAGDHAHNDMAGDGPESWKSVLTQNGFTCEPVFKGTGEVPGIVDIWMDHLKSAMAHFDHE